jgi:phage regulator Rha-like protein
MKLISVPGLITAASMVLAPAVFAGTPDHGPRIVPNVHDTSTHSGPTPKVNHEGREGHEGDHHGNPVPFVDRISANAALLAKITPLLNGMSLADAAKGFRNEQQFIAALHAAKDLGVSFTDLKAEMTGSEHDNLAQAIHDLKPAADAKTAAKTAEREAHSDVSSSRPDLAARITANSTLLAEVTPLLNGMDLKTAASGFHSAEQFIAALHAAKDLGVSFTDLKAEMTGPEHDNLAQAIHDLKPAIDAKTAAKTAAGEARADITAARPSLADRITANAALLAKVTPLLPTGTKLVDDAKGFNSLEQFLAALHAANDLKVSFASIQAEMTGSPHDSLAQAIHDVAPSVDAAAAAKTAAGEAHADIKSTRPPEDHDVED